MLPPCRCAMQKQVNPGAGQGVAAAVAAAWTRLEADIDMQAGQPVRSPDRTTAAEHGTPAIPILLAAQIHLGCTSVRLLNMPPSTCREEDII